MRKVVATRGTQDLGWRNAEAVEGDLVEAVTALKADPGVGKILVPGRSPSSASCSPPASSTSCACSCTPSRPATASVCSTRVSRSTPCSCCAPTSSRQASCTSSTRPSELPGTQTYDDVTDKVPGADS